MSRPGSEGARAARVVGAAALAGAVVAGAAAPAAAEELAAPLALAADPAPPAPLRPPVSTRIADVVTELGDHLDAHLGALSRGTLSLRLDGHARRVRVGLQVDGDGGGLGMRVRSDVGWRDGAAQIRAEVDLSLAGREVHLDLPEVELVPRSFGDESWIEVRLPLLRGTF